MSEPKVVSVHTERLETPEKSNDLLDMVTFGLTETTHTHVSTVTWDDGTVTSDKGSSAESASSGAIAKK